jgi:DNA-binding beta-propeller fold protein YncE
MTENRFHGRKTGGILTVVSAVALATALAAGSGVIRMGKQPDGAFIVSSGQRVEAGAIPLEMRPIDMAMHPTGKFAAILGQKTVFLLSSEGVIPDSTVPLMTGAAYHGIKWTPDGKRCLVSTEAGTVRELLWDGSMLTAGAKIACAPESADPKKNPRPGGMAITRDGKKLFVALCDANAVGEIDLTSNKFVRSYPVQMLPFAVALSEDEKTLIVSNWGGRQPKGDDDKAETAGALIVVDPRGAPDSGTVSLIDLPSGKTVHREIGLHPTEIAVRCEKAYLACAASDAIAEVDLVTQKLARTLPIKWQTKNLFGSMPVALTFSPEGKTLYIANGGDNAIAEMELPSGKIRGHRPVGYYPVQIALAPGAKTAFVLNTKGNGSVRETVKGNKGNAHDYQGTVSILDLSADLDVATAKVAANNGWNRDPKNLKPNLKVYNGAIKHVLYIIKENRTYDEIFGDLPQGNGDPKLCSLGKFMPNHRAIAQEFTLFDNGYVSGTNSADGHAWSTQSVANDYLEHFYDNYRTYPDDGDCAMSISEGGCLWDAAARKGKSIRVYGEFCDDRLATFTPPGKSWMDLWKDRQSRKIKIQVGTRVNGLKPYIHPEFVYWPLLQSDQMRADLFIAEYTKMSREDKVPNLMVMSLPCDHTEGRDPNYPRPQSMMADNDLALGRVVEAVSKSPQWKDTCIFVIEDDAQSGPDHVDGHRTSYMAISPYVRRKFVESTMYTTVSMLRSIELMLGLDPMNRFDAVTPPITGCFTDTPDLTAYVAKKNTIPLDDMNPPVSAQVGRELYWTKKSLALDWGGLDRADSDTLNRVIWHSVKGVDTPYPGDETRVAFGNRRSESGLHP